MVCVVGTVCDWELLVNLGVHHKWEKNLNLVRVSAHLSDTTAKPRASWCCGVPQYFGHTSNSAQVTAGWQCKWIFAHNLTLIIPTLSHCCSDHLWLLFVLWMWLAATAPQTTQNRTSPTLFTRCLWLCHSQVMLCGVALSLHTANSTKSC